MPYHVVELFQLMNLPVDRSGPLFCLFVLFDLFGFNLSVGPVQVKVSFCSYKKVPVCPVLNPCKS